MLASLIVPLIVATVLTVGGRLITEAEVHVNEVGTMLGAAFLVCALLAVPLVGSPIADRGSAAFPQYERLVMR